MFQMYHTFQTDRLITWSLRATLLPTFRRVSSSCLTAQLLPPATRVNGSLLRVLASTPKVRNKLYLIENPNYFVTAKDVLKSLEEVARNLGRMDVRCIGNPSLLRELKDFVSLFEDEDIRRRVSGAMSSSLEKKIEKLGDVLAQSWNSDLEEEDIVREDTKVQNTGDGLESQNSGDGLESQNPRDDLEVQNPGDGLESQNPGVGEGIESQRTPKKNKSEPEVFYKFSPLGQTREKIKCPYPPCKKSYQLVRSLNEHISSKHPGQQPFKEVSDPRGHCKLPSKKDETEQCGGSFKPDQINRHLKDVHKVPIPDGMHLRGWKSKDNGKTWEAVFLNKDDPDPDYEIFIYEASEPSEEIDAEPVVKEIPPLILADNEEAADNDKKQEAADNDKKQGAVNVDEKHEAASAFEKDAGLETTEPVEVRIGKRKREESTSEEDSVKDVEKEKNPRSLHFYEVNDEFESEVSEMEHSQRCKVSRALFVSPTVSVLSVSVGDEEDIIIDLDTDNYAENGDSLLYTRGRILQKQQRYEKRDQVDLSLLKDKIGNIEVFEDFKQHLLRKTVLKSDEKETSTIKKILGHIVLYGDSLVNHESEKDPDFRLQKLIDFKGECLELDHPLDWITSTCENHPGRGIEKLKAHAAFRSYLLHKLAKEKMTGNMELMTRKMCLKEGLEGISKSIADDGLYNQYQTLYQNEREEIKAARYALDPAQSGKASRSVQTWNESSTAKDLSTQWEAIYLEAKKKQKIKAKDFNGFGNYVRFLLATSDKNRGGIYKFLNKHFASRQKQFYPENYDGFSALPEGWNVDVAPVPGAKPSIWVVRLHGAFMKGKKGGEIFFTRKTMDWCERYRTLKQIVSKAKENKEDSFFVNFNGQPLSQIKTTRGTIWAKFEEVTGVTKATITGCVRSAAEEVIQDNPEMSNRVKQLNNHSLAVGSQVYDRNKYNYRGQFVNYMSHKEGENIATGSVEDVNLEAEIKERQEADERQTREDAIEAVEKDKRRRHTTLSSQIRVKSEDRIFLQKLFQGIVGSKFPGKSDGLYNTHVQPLI